MKKNVGYEDVIVMINDSSLWKNFSNLWHKFALFVYWSIGDGVDIGVRYHCWVESCMKLMDINTNGVNANSYQYLEDSLDQHGKWNVDLLKYLFSQNVVTNILAILHPDGNSGRDICCWSSYKNGEYIISLNYKLMCNFGRQNDEDSWRLI